MKNLVKALIMMSLSVLRRDDRPKVVYYHDVGTAYTKMGTPTDLFWRHMALLRPGDMVCFDDGFRGVWDQREHFKASGIRPVVFLPVALVGTEGFLTWSEILILQNEYGFRFESHTWSHNNLVARSDFDLVHELQDSRRELGARLGKDVTWLCYPRGLFSDRVIQAARAAGYQKQFASYPGVLDDGEIVPRNIAQFASVMEFKSILHGGMLPMKPRYYKQHFRAE